MAKDRNITVEELAALCKPYSAFCGRSKSAEPIIVILTKLGVKCAIGKIVRLYNAARRNRDKGGKRKELYAGRCEGIAMTLAKLGYSIDQEKGEA